MANISFPIPPETENQIRTMLEGIAREVIQKATESESKSKDYMNLKECCSYLDCSFVTLKKFINQEQLPYVKIDSKTYISKTSLKEWMKSKEKTGSFEE